MTRSVLWTTRRWKASSSRTAHAWTRLSKTTSSRRRRSGCTASQGLDPPAPNRLADVSAPPFRSLRPEDLGPKELPVVREEEEEEEEEEMETVVLEEPEEKWDCETIISESQTVLEQCFSFGFWWKPQKKAF